MLNYTASGEIESGDVRIQLKATDTIRLSQDRQSVVIKIDRSDLMLWVPETMPVILIVYGARSDVAYWLYVQRHFERVGGFNPFAAGKTVTLHIPRANVLDQDSVTQFSRFRASIQAQRGNVRHDS